MNPTGKRFISVLLVFLLMAFSVNLLAKERRGAKLTVIKLDGQLIKGELITIKPSSLLLLNTEGKDESIDINCIKVIKIKKSMTLVVAGIGFLVGGATGILFGPAEEKSASFWTMYYMSFLWLFISKENAESISGLTNGLVYGAGGALLGGLIGTVVKKEKAIQIEGMTDSELQKTLDNLRKKARIRDYK